MPDLNAEQQAATTQHNDQNMLNANDDGDASPPSEEQQDGAAANVAPLNGDEGRLRAKKRKKRSKHPALSEESRGNGHWSLEEGNGGYLLDLDPLYTRDEE
jgi:hypothetical protein